LNLEGLITEMTEKVIQQIIARFKKENPNLDDNLIRSYIERFEEIKNSPNIQNKDIFSYKWNDFEQLILANPKKRVKAGKVDKSTVDANLIYDVAPIQVFAGSSQQSCIKYGNNHSFCISSRGGNNRYMEYRYEMKENPYFVFVDGDLKYVLMLKKMKPKDGGIFYFDVWDKNNSLKLKDARIDNVVSKYPWMELFINKLDVIPKNKIELGLIQIEKKGETIKEALIKKEREWENKYNTFRDDFDDPLNKYRIISAPWELRELEKADTKIVIESIDWDKVYQQSIKFFKKNKPRLIRKKIKPIPEKQIPSHVEKFIFFLKQWTTIPPYAGGRYTPILILPRGVTHDKATSYVWDNIENVFVGAVHNGFFEYTRDEGDDKVLGSMLFDYLHPICFSSKTITKQVLKLYQDETSVLNSLEQASKIQKYLIHDYYEDMDKEIKQYKLIHKLK